jgi:hypothetical protein
MRRVPTAPRRHAGLARFGCDGHVGTAARAPGTPLVVHIAAGDQPQVHGLTGDRDGQKQAGHGARDRRFSSGERHGDQNSVRASWFRARAPVRASACRRVRGQTAPQMRSCSVLYVFAIIMQYAVAIIMQ